LIVQIENAPLRGQHFGLGMIALLTVGKLRQAMGRSVRNLE
jgi:hypothetical protein